MTLLLTGPNAPNIKTFVVAVPAGHVLPDGKVVAKPFSVTVQAGARWHPDWDAPRYSVMAYRFLPGGDAIGFTGESAKAFPLPAWVAGMAHMHGIALVRPYGKPGLRLPLDVGAPELYAPFKRERIADFLLPPRSLN